MINQARHTSESSRSVDNADNYQSPYATGESRETRENSPDSPNSVTGNVSSTTDKSPTSGNTATNALLDDKTDQSKKDLGSFEKLETEKDYGNKFDGITQTGPGDTQTVTGNQESYSYKDKVPENSVKSIENGRISTPRLKVSLENSSSAQNYQQGTSGRFLDETIDEPLVDLNSGVALTPVACPNEARTWALTESDDSESPGNESAVGYPATSRLFAGSSRDSPSSR